MSEWLRGRRRSVRALVATGVVTLGLPIAAAAPSSPASAAPTELFFSEYIEGSSNNKALEIYNGTGAAVNLASAGYDVFMSFNGGTTTLTVPLTGSVGSGDVYVLAQAAAVRTILDQADQTNGSGWFNGDDAVLLRKLGVVVDAIGQLSPDPGTEWGAGLTSTADNTLTRKPSVCAGDLTASDAFDPAVEWDGFATDTFGGLGSHAASCGGGDAAPGVSSVAPADGAAAVGPAAPITVTFTEAVNLADGAVTLTCDGVAVEGTVSGGPDAYTFDPAVDLASEAECTVTISATAVTDEDTNDPPDQMAADVVTTFTVAAMDPCAAAITPIPEIQGDEAQTPMSGAVVTTRGVVVSDDEGPSPALRGFNLQDPAGDGDGATSDAIFVFNGSENDVSNGDVVTVTGRVTEFSGSTQIDQVQAITKCGTGTVEPTPLTLPFADATAPEAFEHMLVRLAQPVYVTDTFTLGRFGEVVVTSNGDRLPQPTNVVPPGAPAVAMQAANNLDRLVIDDNRSDQNPPVILNGRGGEPLSAENTLRGGDSATGVVGVLGFAFNLYRLQPHHALGGGPVDFQATNDRPVAPEDVGGTIQVAGMNVLNYFNTFGAACRLGVAGAPTECRGASDQAEFDRQVPKTVAAILATGTEVVGLNEIENDGYLPDSALAHVVGALNAATAPGTWAYIDADAGTGQINALGTDAIRVAMIYQPAAVTPVGTTAALNTTAFVNGGDGAPRSRPALAQAFRDNGGGGVFTVVVNHLKSKGSACDAPDVGDGQGNCNQVRVNAVTELVDWLATDPTRTGDPDVLLVGDLNSYAMEDPIRLLETSGYVNLVKQHVGPDAYSYSFGGQWGNLDHALATGTLAGQVTGVTEYHINADEPVVLDYTFDFKPAALIDSLYKADQYRMSDHDPTIVGLALDADPAYLLARLQDVTAALDIHAGIQRALASKLDAAARALAAGDAACAALADFTELVSSQRDKKIPPADADALIAGAGAVAAADRC